MSRNSDLRAYRQHHPVAPDFDSIPGRNWLPALGIIAGFSVVLGTIVIANSGDTSPKPDKVQEVSTCAQEGLSSLALNGYQITRQDVVGNVNSCESSEGTNLTEEQHATLVSTLEATN